MFSTEKHTSDDLKLREIIFWTIDLPDGFNHIRYDFAYVDPASGQFLQYGVDAIAGEKDDLDLQIVPVAKAAIGRILKRKCGLDRAIANQQPLSLPKTQVRARFV